MAPCYRIVDDSRDRLHKAGWSLGETAFGNVWQVDGSNGENLLRDEGQSQVEAWWRAVEEARSLGMLH